MSWENRTTIKFEHQIDPDDCRPLHGDFHRPQPMILQFVHSIQKALYVISFVYRQMLVNI